MRHIVIGIPLTICTRTEKITHVEVLMRVGEKRSMIETIVRRKINCLGHIMRGDGLMKEFMEGKMHVLQGGTR